MNRHIPTDKSREMVSELVQEGKTIAQIAEVLKVSVATARKHYSREFSVIRRYNLGRYNQPLKKCLKRPIRMDVDIEFLRKHGWMYVCLSNNHIGFWIDPCSGIWEKIGSAIAIQRFRNQQKDKSNASNGI